MDSEGDSLLSISWPVPYTDSSSLFYKMTTVSLWLLQSSPFYRKPSLIPTTTLITYTMAP